MLDYAWISRCEHECAKSVEKTLHGVVSYTYDVIMIAINSSQYQIPFEPLM